MKQTDKEIISYHTFMLPFTYDGTFNKKENWQEIPFTCKIPKDYNEYVYFYKHVQDALYSIKENDKKAISTYYRYEQENGSYIIECKKGRYELELDGISLRIFNTKIAILTFNLANRKYYQQKDILAINDFGRRIYPQFLGENYLKETKEAILAESISLILDDKDAIKEDFNSFYNLENIDQKFLPKFVTKLIKENFKSQKLKPIIDDRMFVISQYNSDAIVEKLKQYDTYKESYNYEKDDFWYQYIFVDGDGKNCQSRHMTKKLIAESTYDRWVEWGTLFGVSRYSFVAVTGSWFGKERLLPHMQTLYFQIFTLLLAYRASIIKFSDDIQDVTSMSDDRLVDKSQKLYKRYLNFLNKLYFKEVTAQDQGIELYNKAMKIMDIPKYMADLDNEINELHSYVSMIEEKKTAKTINTLTWIGGVLLPPSLVTGFLGMNSLSGLGQLAWFEKTQYGFWSLGAVVLSASIIPIYLKFFKKEHHE